MILIKTKIGPSKKHKLGLFADQFVPKGTKTWMYVPEFDTAYSPEQVERMSEPAKEQFLHYAFFDKEQDKYVLCFDDQRFINHCHRDPNIESTPYFDVALRDINKGDELLCDYFKFDPEYFPKRGLSKEQLL